MSDDRPRRDHGVYGISVAAELVGMGVQRLRWYESRGLLEPQRSEGGTRRYSDDDLGRLRRIDELLDAGLNLAGVGMVLELEAANDQLQGENDQLQGENDQLQGENDQLQGENDQLRAEREEHRRDDA